ncbi:hypothetical protein LOK49_LG06G00917 [Camellia lanceoleosa]|uniref:Uncharacterized protein n=1 Tax=Camellia lanceoleosa TaxID=1840588 RepID=A0ACC0HEM7_9ERIC|nr:hypothetical protein LOK49_LG06G00917 [Camellia lanceoleosa]
MMSLGTNGYASPAARKMVRAGYNVAEGVDIRAGYNEEFTRILAKDALRFVVELQSVLLLYTDMVVLGGLTQAPSLFHPISSDPSLFSGFDKGNSLGREILKETGVLFEQVSQVGILKSKRL